LTTLPAGGGLPRARRAIWALFVVAFLSNVTIGARTLIIPLYGSDLGLSAASIGLLYAVFAGVSALIAFPAGAMLDHSGSRRVMAAALTLVAVAQVLTMTRSIPVLAVSQALSGTAWTVSQLSIVTASISASQPRQIGRAIGLTALGGQTGLMAGPAIAGTLLQMIGFTNLILLSALPGLVGLGAPDREREALGRLIDVGQGQGGDLAAPEHPGEAKQDDRPVPCPDQRRGVEAVHQPAQLGDARRGGLAWPRPGLGPPAAQGLRPKPRAALYIGLSKLHLFIRGQGQIRE